MIFTYINKFNQNAKVSMMLEPLWAVFWGLVYFYSPLYMKDIGLNEVEIGIVNTVNILFCFLNHFLAAPITNKLGRKRTTLVFDLISWTGAMTIWAISQNFWFFLIAGIVNAFVRIVMVSWNCLVSEDEEEKNRAKIFGMFYLIGSAIGVLTPITGLFIAKYGTVNTLRVLYAVGGVSMTSLFIIRNFFVKETKSGLKLMEEHAEFTILESTKNYIKLILSLYKKKEFVLISVIFIITNFIISINFFQVIFLKNTLGFSESNLSFIPGIGAVLNICLYVFVIPKLKKYHDGIILSIFLAVSAAGAFFFLWIPSKNLPVMLIILSVMAVGLFATQAYRDAVFMNNQGEHEKADMFSAVQTVTTFFCIPAGYIGGLLYDINSYYPFILVVILCTGAFIVSIFLSGILYKKRAS